MRKITPLKLLSRVFFACLVVVAIYLGLQITVLTKPSYTYETVISYSYSDSVLAEGYVLFEETLVTGSGDIGYLVEEGNRVSAGQAVAEYYTSDAQESLRVALEETNAEIALLEDSENTAGTLVDNLVSQRSTAVYNLLTELDQGGYSSTQTYEESYLLAQNKLQVITGAQTDFSQRLAVLTAQSETLAQALGTPETIASPTNGYFVSKNTAQFLSCTLETLQAQSVADFADGLSISNELSSDNIVGKVVSSYTWYFMGVCDIEESDRFKVGASLEIAFPDTTDTVFPATVVAVEEDAASGYVRVTLKCEHIGVDALSLGQETAEIIFTTYEGLRVPSNAIRMQAVEIETEDNTSSEYVKGVYVAYNGVAKFRQIEILYQDGDYILVPLEAESSVSSVRLYDQVIISGTDLYDGKLL